MEQPPKKLINLEIEEAKNVRVENIQNNEELLRYDFELLKGHIELLKQSESWIKEMMTHGKQNAEQDEFFKEHGLRSSLSERSYTVGDVEKEMQNIEEIKRIIKDIHDRISNAQLDIIQGQEYLRILEEMETEFKEMVTRITPEQQN